MKENISEASASVHTEGLGLKSIGFKNQNNNYPLVPVQMKETILGCVTGWKFMQQSPKIQANASLSSKALV